MSKFIQHVKSGAFGLFILAIAGCAATFENHGYAPTDRDMEEIIVGVDTRDSVAQSVGRPTSVGMLDTGGWYYTQSRWRHFAFKAPVIIDRQVVAITYTEAGTVENIERFTLEDGRVVTLSRRVTESNVKGISFIQQLLGNFGNFNPAQALAQ
ncbi:outer membrane protein assembly factor BamE [Profundibacter sp.]